jgi:hypothetical protein
MLFRFLENSECPTSHLQKYVILHYYKSAGSWGITSNFMPVEKYLHKRLPPYEKEIYFYPAKYVPALNYFAMKASGAMVV